MPPIAKTILALGAAVAMVLVAIFVRGRFDKHEEEQALVLRLVCATELGELCETAAKADARIKASVENPADTLRRLAKLAPGEDPGIDAWLTVGPWAAISDGRPNAVRVFQRAQLLASSPLVLAYAPGTRGPAQSSCSGALAVCAARANRPMIEDPLSSGLGLASLAQVVMGAADVSRAIVSSADVQPGTPGGDALAKLARDAAVGSPNLGQLVNAGGAQGNPVFTTEATVFGVPRVEVAKSQPPVAAVVEIALRDPALGIVIEAVRDEWSAALKKDVWNQPPDDGGLPDAGVLASFQSAWAAAA